MAKATSAQTAVAYIAETTWGTTPAGALKELRVLGETLEFQKSALISGEFKTYRQPLSLVHGMHGVSGGVDFEFGDYLDDWLEAALCGTFSSGVLKLGQTLKQFTVERRMVGVGWMQRYTGVRPNGLTIDLEPDAIVKGSFPLLGKTMTSAADGLNGPTGWLVNNVGGYAAGTTTMTIDTGTTNFANGDQFVIYNAGSTTTQRSDQIYTASSGGATSVTFSPGLDVAILDNDILHAVKPATVVTANDPMTSFSGAVTEGGSSLAIATKIHLEINQGMDPSKCIGSTQSQGIIPGGVSVTGSLDLYIENVTAFLKFVNETQSTLQFSMIGSAATYTWLLPKIKYTGAKLNKSSDGKGIIKSLPFTALYDATTELTSVKVTKS